MPESTTDKSTLRRAVPIGVVASLVGAIALLGFWQFVGDDGRVELTPLGLYQPRSPQTWQAQGHPQ